MPDIIKSVKIICVAVILALFWFSPVFSFDEESVPLPPFLTDEVEPNVVLVMDYSGSMQEPAHYPANRRCYYDSRPYSCSGDSLVSCYYDISPSPEDGYDNEKVYYGYFDSGSYYEYNSSQEYWEKTDYSGTHPGDLDRTPQVLHGNFLNYLVMSRIDLSLKALIGGKAECPDGANYCVLRPQGGRRWVEVPDTDGNTIARFHIRPENYAWGDYKDKDILISVDSSTTSTIGTCSDLYAKVKVNDEAYTGIVQNNFRQVRFTFIAYANGTNDTAEQGMIKYSYYYDKLINDLGMESMISAIENTVPYYSTYTGEAMREAYYYLKQDSNMAGYNSDYHEPGTKIDPYYEVRNEGTEEEVVDPAWCRKSHVVLISDGEWNGSVDPYQYANLLHTEDLRTADGFQDDQTADVYTLFAFSDALEGIRSMKTVAAFGNYEDIDGCTEDSPYGLDVTDDSRYVDYSDSNFECNPDDSAGDSCCREWDEDGDGVPDTYFSAAHGDEMEAALGKIFREIKQGTSSGTAVTAITSEVSTGSVMTQAAFYPERDFGGGRNVEWVGNLYGIWYLNAYIDDALVQNIREDTNENRTLDVPDDYILEYQVDQELLQINAYDSGDDGFKENPDSPDNTYTSLDDVSNLINYGYVLENTPASDRKILGVAEDGESLLDFTTLNSSQFDALLGNNPDEYDDCLLDSGSPNYQKLISFVRGEEVFDCRSRISRDGNVWKLGDIISSSPTVVNHYDDDNKLMYRMVYAGSNDGMLHAFRLGHIKPQSDPMHPATLCQEYDLNNSIACDEDKIGKEEWAFIPIDSMPYLRYMADPAYKHIYGVDLKPYRIDISSAEEDKIVLVGGMRLGGGCANGPDYVQPPSDIPADLLGDEPQVGLSSYFALDITDPLNPDYLWRFTTEGMGFTYSGPAYVKRKDSSGDYRHFVVIASGPTDYDGTAQQPLQIYVVDLETGELLYTHEEPNFNNAYGGRLFNDGIDMDKDGQTDYVLLGFTNNANPNSDTYEQLTGGVYKVYTGGTNPGTDWDFDVLMSNNIGDPVTGPVKVMKCFPETIPYPYMYFGSGRFFVPDDKTEQNTNDFNHLYGIPFVCDAENNCDTTSISNLTKASDLDCSDLQGEKIKSAGWKVPLNIAQGNYLRERCYTDAVTSDRNIVAFSTAMPSSVVCDCGGQSRTWVLNCATGMGLNFDICDGTDDSYMVDAELQFKVFQQLSGGDIQQYGRSDFDDTTGSTGPPDPGLPGGDPPPLMFPPQTDTEIYWKQR
ncbi:MAG: hypothetical protein K9J85_08190 [Desulfobacteraceae bacterium]|nr:hypothetical protein [Desulfobacteraceae bacterium]